MFDGSNLVTTCSYQCCYLQVTPPSIDYTLPSPPIGLPGQIVPDPPWMPLFKLKLEELAANQEGSVGTSLLHPISDSHGLRTSHETIAVIASLCHVNYGSDPSLLGFLSMLFEMNEISDLLVVL